MTHLLALSGRGLDIEEQVLNADKFGRLRVPLVLQRKGDRLLHVLEELVNGLALRVAGSELRHLAHIKPVFVLLDHHKKLSAHGLIIDVLLQVLKGEKGRQAR